jgi:hypothetical protein
MDVYRAYFSIHPPARSCLAVKSLAREDLESQIECIAPSKADGPIPRSSRWGPVLIIILHYPDHERRLGEEGMGHFIVTTILMVVYSGVGLVLLMVAYRLVDAFAPFDVEKKIVEDNSTAAALLLAGLFVALGCILGAVIIRP